MREIVKKDRCCGCAACEQKCPKHAICMTEDKNGFQYPVIDQSQCVNCKKCVQVCPVSNTTERTDDLQKCYAAQNREQQEVLESSSGGVFSLLARAVIQQGGVVVGAAFDEKFEVKHLVIETEEELYKIRGSKYVQSNTEGIYKQVRTYLGKKRLVFFSGTPCQVNGLYGYLGGSSDLLITTDLVCHGVPSPVVWRKYKDERTEGDNIQKVNFREKSNGWVDFALKIDAEKAHYHKNYMQDEYMYAFMQNWSLRKSCYQCEVKGMQRKSDITLADYWGYKGSFFPHKDLGVSMMILHTQKAVALFNEIKADLLYEEKELNTALSGNGVYYDSVPLPRKRALFFTYLRRNTVSDAVHKLTDSKGIRPKIKMAAELFVIDHFKSVD